MEKETYKIRATVVHEIEITKEQAMRLFKAITSLDTVNINDIKQAFVAGINVDEHYPGTIDTEYILQDLADIFAKYAHRSEEGEYMVTSLLGIPLKQFNNISPDVLQDFLTAIRKEFNVQERIGIDLEKIVRQCNISDEFIIDMFGLKDLSVNYWSDTSYVIEKEDPNDTPLHLLCYREPDGAYTLTLDRDDENFDGNGLGDGEQVGWYTFGNCAD